MRFPWRSRSQRDADLDDEIQAHLRMAEADRIARGETVADAAQAARREFGNVSHIKEVTREAWHAGEVASRVFDRIHQDVGYALRGLRRSPGFTVTIVLTLALGVGANSAIFSFLDRVFLKPPEGVSAPSEVRRLYIRSQSTESPTGFSVFPFFNYPGYAAVRDALGPDADVVAYTAPSNSSIPRDAAAIPLTVSFVSPNYFRTLRVPLALGRYFSPDEERIEVPAPLAVISHALWSRAFGLDSSIIGREIQIGNSRVSVIGVTERRFMGIDVDAADAFVALSAFSPDVGLPGMTWYQSGGSYLFVFARIRPPLHEGGPLARAAIAYNTQPDIRFYGFDRSSTILTGPLSSARGPQDQGQEVAISTRVAGVSVVVLLIACANMANLLLVRATRRRREIAVRLAMGVSRNRLLGQLLTESVCLALLGGLAAVGVAWWGGQALRKMLLPNVHWPTGVIDLRVIAVTGFVALCIGIAGGIAPAVQARRQNVVDSLKNGSRDGTYRRSRLRAGLLVVQAALSIVLIAGAGLFVRSLGNVRDVDIGYDIDSLAYVSPAPTATIKEQEAFEVAVPQLAERLASEEGVIGTTPASTEPMSAQWTMGPMWLPGRDSIPSIGGRYPYAQFNRVSPRHFTTVGTRVLAGRVFAENEPLTSVVVNEKMAQIFWPGQNPLGQCLILDASKQASCSVVIGVVENAHRWRIVEDASMQYFLPAGPMRGLILRMDPARWRTIAARVRTELATMPMARSISVSRMTDRLAGELRPWRMGAALFTAFGVLSLLVAAVGVYSVVAYGVSQRIQEMGVRIALGARARDVISLVVGEGIRGIAIGTIIGIAIAIALGKFIAALLYGVTPRDPGVMIASVITLTAVGILAALLPAWRASRVDPVTALRAE